MDEKEKRIRAITKVYYSNPKVQEAILKFASGREVVPRYLEGFGKRPDSLQYNSDIMGLVNKGATSFHSSEEIWTDPFSISSEMSAEELNSIRKGWDLLIDIDSPYFDLSKTLTLLILKELESYGVGNYGLKFSGNKGFHIIVSGKAFPEEYNGRKMNESFPDWPRAICRFLMKEVRAEYNKKAREVLGGVEKIKKKTKLSEDEITEALCPECGRAAKKGRLVTYRCPECESTITRRDVQTTKRRLKCTNDWCAGVLEVEKEEPYFYCEYCKNVSSIKKIEEGKKGKVVYSDAGKSSGDYSGDFGEEVAGAKFGASDLVLVAPRHLFRMPYSLHEKTGLASVVLRKEELESFAPRDADPLKVKIRNYFPENREEEAAQLLADALEWSKKDSDIEEDMHKKKYKSYEKVDFSGVSESDFPAPIKKLLMGGDDGKQRGLFILLTFFRSLGFSADYINEKVREWNKKNKQPLKEGYIRSQIEWHLRQKRQILPPNYDNESFYKDLGLIDAGEGKQKAKNPIVEVARKMRARKN